MLQQYKQLGLNVNQTAFCKANKVYKSTFCTWKLQYSNAVPSLAVPKNKYRKKPLFNPKEEHIIKDSVFDLRQQGIMVPKERLLIIAIQQAKQ